MRQVFVILASRLIDTDQPRLNLTHTLICLLIHLFTKVSTHINVYLCVQDQVLNIFAWIQHKASLS